jgi:glyoxylase-like metal-dependent hydrolase (beta-lactamase superfamily II)/8-oxo-dGTP pyrophosphatase MutT (NUDIX family)
MSTAKLIEAVTAVLVHDDEIYMIRRHAGLPSFPGYYAFPGGKVDAEDAANAPKAAVFGGHDPRFLRALIREIREEIGIDLEADAHLPEAVDLIGRAIPPEGPPTRFDTRFFRVRLPHRPEFTHDPREVHGGAWASARSWMERYRSGNLLLAPPTRIALDSLAADLATESISFEERISRDGFLMIESVYGVRQFFVRSHTLPPAQFTNCFLIGDDDAHRILVDPAPKSDELAEALIARVSALGVNEIFLTHHHIDHRERADVVARRLGVGLAMSADTHSRIRARNPGFFDALTVRLVHDGEPVTRWLGQPVRAWAVPGHDEGQLALMPDDHAWCIVGDLIQGIGTVVIAAPEGNMSKYFASLERVIAWNPRVVFPSHGLGQGGVFFIEQTLRHRRQREAQVLELHLAGKPVDEMLPVIYAGIDPRLLPLARMNIESHLVKLREEGRIAA